MAMLRRLDADHRVLLPDDAVIGRSRNCDVLLEHPTGSAIHARFQLHNGRWKVCDLNSRNGTWVDGKRLTLEPQELRPESELMFGSRAETWVLEDASPSGPFARSDQDYLCASDGMLSLPSRDASPIRVRRAQDKRWRLEGDRSAEVLEHREVRVIGDRSYRFYLPMGDSVTEELILPPLPQHGLDLRDNGDSVHAALVDGCKRLDLGSRAHHVVLLALARAWLHDQRLTHLAPPERGWLHREDIVDQANLADASHLNVLIFRLRRQLERLEVLDAAEIIERRPGKGELRLGLQRVSVHA